MSNIDEILKFKELLDSNIITQEEFEKKKKELLNNNVNEKTTINNISKDKKKSFSEKFKEFNKITLTSKKTNKKSHPILTILLFLLFIGFITTISVPNDPNYKNKTQLKNEEILAQYSVSYSDTDKIITECGFNNYTLEYVGEENEIYYFIIRQNNNISGGLNIKDGQVSSIDYANNMLYENGAVQHTLSEYIVTSKEKVDLVYETQDVIKNILKSPSTAKFPWVDEWTVGKKDGSTIVQGYVDSQNGFGAMIRSTFQVTYTNNIVTSLIFDGQEYTK